MAFPEPHPRDREAGSEWRTPAEASDYRLTPTYAETIEFLEQFVRQRPDMVRIEDFGKTGEGRDLKVVIVSKGGIFEPDTIRASDRRILLVQNCIHAGEPDGKDACLALLRDIVTTDDREGLLANVVLVFIPVYNIDGHERRSAYHRINQNGPELAGWRGNATNLNLNRDYLKADAPETRAFLRLLQRWRPDFFVDDHVTDGADFQYDVTFVLDAGPDVFPGTAAWLRETVTPELVRHVNASGHLAFPTGVFLNDDSDPSRGLAFNENPPRFSTGRMVLENRPALLVEMHMLKEYRTRVTGNYEVLRAVLKLMNRYATTVRTLNEDADLSAAQLGSPSTREMPFPLVVEASGETEPVTFEGFDFSREPSDVSGAMAIRYGRTPTEMTVPWSSGARVAVSVQLPAGYIIPPQWTPVIEVLEAQGVVLRRTTAEWTGKVGRYRCSGMQRPRGPFEGRYPILRAGNVEQRFGHFGTCTLSVETLTFPAASVVVSLDQRLSKVAIHWLEPEAPDSALRWGFFDSTFEQKENAEAYVLESLAREEFAKDPPLKAEFEARLRSDAEFAASPAARLAFFYDRSPWWSAQRIGEYPVGRLLSTEGLPLG